MTKQPLNENEQKALDVALPCIEQAYETSEILVEVAGALNISKNAAKGYLGQLVAKGYLGTSEERVNGRKVLQFFLIN